MSPEDPSAGIAPPRRRKPSSPDPYPVNNSEAVQRAACDALAELQRSRPMKPPGVRR